jgi:two-component system cell cycle response regulator DivK
MPVFPPLLRECRVLLADDDALVRAVYADTLRSAGCQVTEAANGGEAVALAPGLMPELVLLDLSMPMMDGWQALAALRADPRTRGLVVVALTASDTSDVRARAAAAGFDGFVLKPFTPRALLRELEAVWERALSARRAPPSQAAEHCLPELTGRVLAM